MKEHAPPRAPRPPVLRAGDEVRLKFLYPGGNVEIIDCTWVTVTSLGAAGVETPTQWVVIRFQGRDIWKPLSSLVQVELLAPAPDEAAGLPSDIPSPRADDIRYYG